MKVSTLKDVEMFIKVLGKENVFTDVETLKPFNTDWTHKHSGTSKCLLFPTNTTQVSIILKYCNEQEIPLVPQGGITGLVGGGVPIKVEVILNMRKLQDINITDNIIEVGSGVILENAMNAVALKDRMMPIELGSKGTAQIGGLLACNAGGIRYFRYGSLRQNCLGLEFVDGTGTVHNLMRTQCWKDNTGYDLKSLLIGSEGTLGVITRAALYCPPAPRSEASCLLRFSNFEDLLNVALKAKNQLVTLSACESWDAESDALVNPHNNKLFSLLIELQSQKESVQEELEDFCAGIMHLTDENGSMIAQDQVQSKEFMREREEIPVKAVSIPGAVVYKYDVSLPLCLFYAVVHEARRLLGKRTIVIGYGHLLDGNVHLNVIVPEAEGPEVQAILEPHIYEWTARNGGSISAEHGIGLFKRDYLSLAKSPETINLFRRIKSVFDPKGILNPKKLLPNM